MPSYAYFCKQFVPISEANLGVMTHCLHYGTAVFEGIRGNWNADEKQLYLFRLVDRTHPAVSDELQNLDLGKAAGERGWIGRVHPARTLLRGHLALQPLSHQAGGAEPPRRRVGRDLGPTVRAKAFLGHGGSPAPILSRLVNGKQAPELPLQRRQQVADLVLHPLRRNRNRDDR